MNKKILVLGLAAVLLCGASVRYTATSVIFYAAALSLGGDSGQLTSLKQNSVQSAALSGATVDLTGLIPAKSQVIGMTCRVTTLITGATTFDVGTVATPALYCNDVPVALNTVCDLGTNQGSSTGPLNYAAATDVRLTANGSNFTGGVVRCTVHYADLTAATS